MSSAISRFLDFARYAVAALLVLIGLRTSLKIASVFFSGETHSSGEAFLTLQLLLLPCSLLAAAWLLITHKHRAVALTVLFLSSLAWVPSLFKFYR